MYVCIRYWHLSKLLNLVAESLVVGYDADLPDLIIYTGHKKYQRWDIQSNGLK